ncbi:hypothetical protein [Porphyromonas gulae]|uniref:hypothetical protein n=1 Tax=Porphyromonas gulae TaxID=111105 RepID=UPI001269FDD0|nr:hypothetical protein [Porphyromonas gulae]
MSEGAGAASAYPSISAAFYPYSYPQTNIARAPGFYKDYPRDSGIATFAAGVVNRVCSLPSAITHYLVYPHGEYTYGDKAVTAEFSKVKFELIREDGLPDTTPYLPHIDELNAEIRARSAEIVAANPPAPPSVWPLERTYIRDFTLSTQTIPYELLLCIEGLGEVVIVRSGSLARGAGSAQELFSNVPRDMTKFRATIVCRQGRHTYTPEQTAAMFDVTWPAGSEQVNGCKAVMTSLDFNLSITPKY